MIKDTSYNLQIHLQRIDEKLVRISVDNSASSDTSVDLQDEKAVTRQCLQICNKARSYIESIQNKQPVLLQNRAPTTLGIVQTEFEAQILTSKTLNDNRYKILKTIRRLQKRLGSIISEKPSDRTHGKSRLQEDLDISRQYLEIYDQAAKQVSHQKIHTVREVVTDDNTNQIIVTTLADLFDVKKVWAKNRSAQLVGSITDDTLQKMSTDRYKSRFSIHYNASSSLAAFEITDNHPRPRNHPNNNREPAGLKKGKGRPFPNKIRKRTNGRDYNT